MKTTIFINDIRADFRHWAFFSPSSAGLEYSTLPREAFGEMGGPEADPKPADMSLKDWLAGWDRLEAMEKRMKMAGEWDRD